MIPKTPETPKPTKTPDPKNPEPAPSAVSPAPEASNKSEVAAKPEASKSNKSGKAREGRRVLSVSIPEKLARQVRLLCSVTGTSAQELVESALRRAVSKQLAGALDAIKSDVEG